MSQISSNFEKDVRERTKHLNYITTLPQKGLSTDEILEITEKNLGLGRWDLILDYKKLS